MFLTGANGLMAVACRGDGVEAGQAIRERCAAGRQVISGRGADCLGSESGHRIDFGVTPAFIHESSRNDENNVILSLICNAARKSWTEVC